MWQLEAPRDEVGVVGRPRLDGQVIGHSAGYINIRVMNGRDLFFDSEGFETGYVW